MLRAALVGLMLAGCSTQPAAPLAPDPCQAWWGCPAYGLCHTEGPLCVARTDADCAPSALCRESGRCRATFGFCSDGAPRGLPTTDADCRRQDACTHFGQCHREGAFCIAHTAAECRASPACRETGECSLQHGLCVATDADCARLASCPAPCRARRGSCPTAPFIYFQF